MAEPDVGEIIWLLKAEIDFQEIYNRIDRYSEKRAEDFYASVNTAVDQLALFPEIGFAYAFPIRRVLALRGRYGVFDRVDHRGVVILGIEDLRQDPDRIRRSLGIDD